MCLIQCNDKITPFHQLPIICELYLLTIGLKKPLPNVASYKQFHWIDQNTRRQMDLRENVLLVFWVRDFTKS